MSDDRSLTQILLEAGYTHRPPANPHHTGRAVYQGEVLVWSGSARECFRWLRATGVLRDRQAPATPVGDQVHRHRLEST